MISKNKYKIALFLYIFTSISRILLLDSGIIQPDEFHWVTRSQKIISKFHNEPEKMTSHLGQPGLTPALIMTSGLVVARKIYSFQDIPFEEIDYLKVCRISVVIFSSLIVPLVFLLGLIFFGNYVSLLAAILMIFDPRILADSKIAHLDTIQTVFIFLTVYLYAYGVSCKKYIYKLFAGVVWGLAVLAKPTALFLLPALFLYKLFNYIKYKNNNNYIGEKSILSWSDFYCLIIGNAIFAIFYTRMWQIDSEYQWRLKISSFIADYTFFIGNYLSNHIYISYSVICALLLLALYMFKKKHVSYILVLIIFIVLTLSYLPHVYRNLILFWTWVLGLSSETHNSFGHIVHAPEYGYLTLFYSILPDIILYGFCLGIIGLTLKFKEKKPEVFLIILVIVFWIIGLSSSGKQSWRYVMPILPFVYLISAYVLVSAASIFKEKTRVIALSLIVCFQALVLYSWSPNYQIYFNYLSGELKGAEERGQHFEYTGAAEVINFLSNNPDCQQCNVALFSNDNIFRHIIVDKKLEDKIIAKYFRPKKSNYVVYTKLEKDEVLANWKDRLYKNPIYSYNLKGVDLLMLNKVEPFRNIKPIKFNLGASPKFTGKSVKRNSKIGIIARPHQEVAGNIFYTLGLNVAPGEYYLKFAIKDKTRASKNKKVNEETKVLKIELNDCSKEVLYKDLNPQSENNLELYCSVKENSLARPGIAWYGKVPILLTDVEFGLVK